MESKEKVLKDIQTWVFSFNEYWEDPVTESELIKNPIETCDLIIAYCNVIKAKQKKLGKKYDEHPKDVQEAISKIISLVSDGRDLRYKVKYEHINYGIFDRNSEPREYDHHVNKTGYLGFEDNPMNRCEQIIRECEKLKEIINSEKETKNFDKFIGKILYWENYESGSAAIKITRIDKNKNGEYTFDGVLITYETVNGSCDGDGYIMSDIEDYPFEKIPYCYCDWETEEEVYESLESAEEYTLKKLYKSLYETTRNLFECYFDCRVHKGIVEEWEDYDEEDSAEGEDEDMKEDE
jgi:hypothetical protein